MATRSLQLSVVLATYNGARYLPAQLESLRNQHLQPNELIITDDGSSDATVEIANAFAAAAPFAVRVHRQPTNLGVHQNFGHALATVSGDVIFCCDQDDVWLPEKLARFAEVFDRNPDIGFVMGNADLVDESLRPLGVTLWEKFGFDGRDGAVGATQAYDIFSRRMPIYGCTIAFRATLRDRLLPVPANWAFDSWIGSVSAVCTGCWLVRRPYQMYRQHASQVTGFEGGSRLKKLVGVVTHSDTANVLAEMRRSEVILRHFRTLPESPVRAAAERLTRQRYELAQTRLTARRSLAWRVPLVSWCVVNGSYFRSARGLFSAAVDLLAKPERLL